MALNLLRSSAVTNYCEVSMQKVLIILTAVIFVFLYSDNSHAKIKKSETLLQLRKELWYFGVTTPLERPPSKVLPEELERTLPKLLKSK